MTNKQLCKCGVLYIPSETSDPEKCANCVTKAPEKETRSPVVKKERKKRADAGKKRGPRKSKK